MKTLAGCITKMRTSLAQPVQYYLPIGGCLTSMNEILGRHISIEFLDEIECTKCGRVTTKSFAQGYCYPCFKSLAECDLCIVRPETCHYHQQTCRDPEWAQNYCMKQHVVYLANTSALKVGITRATQVPTRWIDQGASQALPVYKVKNRYHSGLVEVILKKYVADKTNWRKLLKDHADSIDMVKIRNDFLVQIGQEVHQLQQQYDDFEVEEQNQDVVEIEYPILSYPEKINSINLEKTPKVAGVLQGIKGQYLMLDCGVFNMRKYTGYKIKISFWS